MDTKISKIKIGDNLHDINSEYWGGYNIGSLKTINGESILIGSDDINDINDINPQFIEINYSDLKGLRNGNNLIPGQKYRITDYLTTTSQENTQSAEHQFDIIVEALSKDTLSEDAKAIQNENENKIYGYFNASNLEAWELKYCLDNDTSRFAWADDSENGKGVIYYMKDEFGNEAPYDFKNIQFIFNSTEYANWKSVVLGQQYTGAFYTFSYYNKQSEDVVVDDSLKVYQTTPNHYAHGNKVNNYFRNSDSKLTLNNIVFVATGNSPYNNIIENGCHDCIFGDKCYGNTIGFNASNNVVCNNFYNNKIGNNCLNNIFPRQFYSCECGDNFMNNDFIANSSLPDLSAVINCIFGNNFKNNTDIDVRLYNIEILDNTLNSTLPDKVNWNTIIVDNGKTINKCLSDYKNYFKLFIGLDENKRVFIRDFNEQCIYHMGNFTNLQEALQKAATAEIAGNISLSKISFTIGRIDNLLTATNEGLQTGYIEQYVSENVSTQVIIWKSGFRMRKITFKDNNRIEIHDSITDSIKNGDANSEGVYWSNPTSLYYDQASHKIALTRFDDGQTWGLDACFGEVEIPLVNDSRAGLMSSDDKSILTNLNKIVKSKVYNSLPLPEDEDEYENYLGKKYWYRFARINDKSPNIFRISTNAANDVIFTSSIGWSNGNPDYDRTGALGVINCSMKSNPAHAFIEGIRLVASPDGGYIDMLLNTPYENSDYNGYVEIYVTCISTISNIDNSLYDTIEKLEEKGGDFNRNGETIIQSFDLVDRAMISKDFYFTNENGDQISVAGSIVDLENKLSPIQNISYSDLKGLRSGNNLIPGQKYRITDYVTTTSQPNTESANHQFDIIVEALSKDTLSENAKAIQNENDGYFDDSNLEAWELKYCLDNDTDRFAWADDSENGKGVIYYMKDEFNNECPYDFKNILFKKNDVYYYTFSFLNDGDIEDATVTTKNVYNNKILSLYDLYEGDKKMILNCNTFLLTDNQHLCVSNYIGKNCKNNTFGSNCMCNTLESYCENNTFGDYIIRCKFGDKCKNCKLTDSENGNGNLLSHVKMVEFGSECVDVNLWSENNLWTINNNSSDYYIQNYILANSLSGSIKITGDGTDERNREYTTKIAKNSKGDVKQYCEADLIK